MRQVFAPFMCFWYLTARRAGVTWCYLCLAGSKDDSYITSEFPEDPVNLQSSVRVC